VCRRLRHADARTSSRYHRSSRNGAKRTAPEPAPRRRAPTKARQPAAAGEPRRPSTSRVVLALAPVLHGWGRGFGWVRGRSHTGSVNQEVGPDWCEQSGRIESRTTNAYRVCSYQGGLARCSVGRRVHRLRSRSRKQHGRARRQSLPLTPAHRPAPATPHCRFHFPLSRSRSHPPSACDLCSCMVTPLPATISESSRQPRHALAPGLPITFGAGAASARNSYAQGSLGLRSRRHHDGSAPTSVFWRRMPEARDAAARPSSCRRSARGVFLGGHTCRACIALAGRPFAL
jgi:hypothetical protein